MHKEQLGDDDDDTSADETPEPVGLVTLDPIDAGPFNEAALDTFDARL